MTGLQLDVNDPASLSRLSIQLRDGFPELNVLFANPGISRSEDMTSEAWTADNAEAIVAEVLQLLETGNTPHGEALPAHDHALRWSERNGSYHAHFSVMNLG